MIHPKIPVNPLPTGLVTPFVQPTADVAPHHTAAVPACGCEHAPAPVPASSGMQVAGIRLTPAGVVTALAAGTGVVLVVGAVLVSMLLAVAITGASVAVCAVVLRSLLNQHHRR
ncbi:SpdD-like protein [Streptomyces sp. NBC_00091]|uniref:SpdD-like protein n=1 Tax=Streptomyces sp. NBC_00091 TaxID=2975648 RepID=UPI00225297A0|nr:SpdD-like protein [Streptomyces sp. NBC_00091]MCX5378535.1 SpdD-like protein [Streptomyces sp. NBC_00091]